MKIIIQIPCYNEADTLSQTIRDLPTSINGADSVEVLVIDDGSTDETATVARDLGVKHVIRHSTNKGLATAFQSGLDACLQLRADIIVNTDADNQYPGDRISDLVQPVLDRTADIVVGDRQIDRIPEFSLVKRILQKLGSAAVRYVSGTHIPDAPSGFRAFSREAALHINVLSGYTYTLETIIQAGKKNMTIAYIPIQTNPKLRDSRLVKSNLRYVLRSMATILRLFVLYEPLKTFAYVGLPFFLFGIALWVRYLALLLISGAQGHIQSVVVGAVSILMALLLWSLGVVGELLATNRRILDETLYHAKRAALPNEPRINPSGDTE